jgi:hypothetical protein
MDSMLLLRMHCNEKAVSSFAVTSTVEGCCKQQQVKALLSKVWSQARFSLGSHSMTSMHRPKLLFSESAVMHSLLLLNY